MARVLFPLADTDLDPTEVAVPWDRITRAGHEVVFATESGRPAAVDPRLMGEIVFRGLLAARPENIALYRQMEATAAFQAPVRLEEVAARAYDALHLHGGHAPGMRQYLECESLRRIAAGFLSGDRPVGAICHGVLVLARTTDAATGKSVLGGRRVTALTKRLERSAYWLTAWKLGGYYRTYPAYVADEVRAALGPQGRFEDGPFFASYARPFHVRDGSLVTARWPGDAAGYAQALVEAIAG
jgi:putative intracellular protease/amidase